MTEFSMLTIIAEEALSSAIEKEIIALGAKGYTTSTVSGRGISGIRDNQWEGENVKIETVATNDTCKAILAFIEKNYFDKYAIIAFHFPVTVIRTDHFA
jgi:hypothetical protein